MFWIEDVTPEGGVITAIPGGGGYGYNHDGINQPTTPINPGSLGVGLTFDTIVHYRISNIYIISPGSGYESDYGYGTFGETWIKFITDPPTEESNYPSFNITYDDDGGIMSIDYSGGYFRTTPTIEVVSRVVTTSDQFEQQMTAELQSNASYFRKKIMSGLYELCQTMTIPIEAQNIVNGTINLLKDAEDQK